MSISTGDRQSRLILLSIVVGGALAFIFLKLFFAGKNTNFEDASAMGAQTTSIFASIGGHLIHCRDSRDVDDCIDGVTIRKPDIPVLWLGNSQLHAINQWHKGEVNSTPILFELLKKNPNKQSLDLITFSQPNANFQEHYVLFEYLIQKLPIKVLILPIVFDDTREDGLRKEIEVLTLDEATKKELSKTEIGQKILRESASHPQDSDTSGISETLQEVVEKSLNLWLLKHSELWELRSEMRGWIFSEMYIVRNAFFGINPTTKRKAIRSRYNKNIEAFEAILSLAHERGVRVVAYIAPIRGDVEIPYVRSEYAKFKGDVSLIALHHGAKVTNLEELIPPNLWGQKDTTAFGSGVSELDFMHFQAQGHKILASKINELILDVLSDSKGFR